MEQIAITHYMHNNQTNSVTGVQCFWSPWWIMSGAVMVMMKMVDTVVDVLCALCCLDCPFFDQVHI
jgi:hypothetical protein